MRRAVLWALYAAGASLVVGGIGMHHGLADAMVAAGAFSLAAWAFAAIAWRGAPDA